MRQCGPTAVPQRKVRSSSSVYGLYLSILYPDLKRRVAAEMMRVVKPEGFILWYDYYVNNPWNSDVRGIKRREIFQLFPDSRIDLARTTLLPPLARVLAPYSYLGCYLLEEAATALYSLFRRYSESITRILCPPCPP